MPDDDDTLAALVRAIAWELIQLGYRPSTKPCYLTREGKADSKLVAQETWQAMREILDGRKP